MGECPVCGFSVLPRDYRCPECGKDLVDVHVEESAREERTSSSDDDTKPW